MINLPANHDIIWPIKSYNMNNEYANMWMIELPIISSHQSKSYKLHKIVNMQMIDLSIIKSYHLTKQISVIV